MRSNKGFTLIELLAVIVILAIIALITVPVVIKIIDNAKKGAAEDSTYGVIETAKLFWTLNQYDLSVANQTVTFTCSSAGVCQGTVQVSTGGGSTEIGTTTQTVTLDIDGTKPKAGTISIDFSSSYGIEVSGLKFGDYTCSKAKTASKVTCSN